MGHHFCKKCIIDWFEINNLMIALNVNSISVTFTANYVRNESSYF